MTTLARLERWRQNGAITEAQCAAISAIVRKDRFSVFVELNALLYLGVLSIVAGVGWVIQRYVATLGDAAILSALTLLLLICFYYCFSRALPYSPGQVESPNFVFDYALYLGCLVFGVELGYIETRFHLMRANWDVYLLVSSALFFVLAYRFDNRLVLSLALSTLAGWFGLKTSRFAFISTELLRQEALVYGVLVAAAGRSLYKLGIKKHFTETYLHVAANIVFLALVSGVLERDSWWALYLLGLLALAAVSVIQGIRLRRFIFVVYGAIYGYIGISAYVLHDIRGSSEVLAYFVVSGSLVIASLVLLARRFGREE